jgi:hypothetical protein
MTYTVLSDGEQQAIRNERIRSMERAHYQATLDVELAENSGDPVRIAKARMKLDDAEKQLTLTRSALV